MKVTIILAALAALFAAQAAKVDVATIKRNKDAEAFRAAASASQPIGPARMGIMVGGRLMARGISAMELVREGYGFVPRPAADVMGGPGWADTERYDVSIKADRSEFGPPGPFGLLPQDAAEVVRDFLADRFKLKAHTEKRERTLYELRVARSDGRLGAGLTPADGSCLSIYALPNPGLSRCEFVLGGGRGVQLGNITMAELAVFFSAFPAVNAEIVDKTGLAGAYNVKMSAFIGGGISNAAPDDPRPSMVAAVQEMLGLKLERIKGPSTVLIVDHVERPTEN